MPNQILGENRKLTYHLIRLAFAELMLAEI